MSCITNVCCGKKKPIASYELAFLSMCEEPVQLDDTENEKRLKEMFEKIESLKETDQDLTFTEA